MKPLEEWSLLPVAALCALWIGVTEQFLLMAFVPPVVLLLFWLLRRRSS
jgi:hypothetical protein